MSAATELVWVCSGSFAGTPGRRLHEAKPGTVECDPAYRSHWGCGWMRLVDPSTPLTYAADADLIGELVRRGVLKQADADLLWEEADRVSTYDKHGGMGAAGL